MQILKTALFAVAVSMMTLAAAGAQAAAMSFEEAQALALAEVPGIVVDTERSIHNGAVVFEFDIRQESGVVMAVEVDSASREILDMRVLKMAGAAGLPEAKITPEQAQKLAAAHIQNNTPGLRAAEITGQSYEVFHSRLAYVFTAQRGIAVYELALDADTGEVFFFEKR